MKETDQIEVAPTKNLSENMETFEMEIIRHPTLSVKEIPEPTASAPLVVIQEKNLYKTKRAFSEHNNDWWNKVIVRHGGRVDKNEILSEMNKQIFDRTLFYPCYYQEHNDYDTFLLYKNFSALEMMVQKDLKMKIDSKQCTVTFELNMYYAEWNENHVNWQKSIDYVMKGRMLELSLNLSEFVEDPGFDDLIVSMTTVQGISYILNTARNLNSTITEINLRGNHIESIEGLQFLRYFFNLKSIDLSINDIESIENFPSMASVIELRLDGNDVCRKFYNKPWRYVEELLRKFPNLKYIDDRRIDLMTSIVPIHNFYIGQNLLSLIESFIKFFFNSYDNNRELLDRLYDKDSLYSISCSHQLSLSWGNSRNLLESFDASEVIIGRNISKVQKSSPKTTHDFATMCVDVPFFNQQNILVNVTGYFKIISASSIDRNKVLGFTRSFILERKRAVIEKSYKYIVKHEQLLIREISNDENNKAFKCAALAEEDIPNTCSDEMPTKQEHEDAAISMLHEQLKLKRIWCRR